MKQVNDRDVPTAVGKVRVRTGLYIGLFLLALTGTVLLFGSSLRQNYTQAISAAYADVGNLAWVLDSRLSGSLRRLDAGLQQMRERAKEQRHDFKDAARSRAAWTKYLDDLKINFPEVMDFYVVDARGDVVYASGEPKFFNVADRSHFQRLASDPAAELVHTDVVVSRADGKPTMVFGRALRDDAGKFKGIVSVLVDLGQLQRLFQAVEVGSQGILALRTSDENKLVLRQPHIAAEVNKITRSANFDRVKAGEKVGFSLFTSPLDGTRRITVFRALDEYPFFIYIARAESEVLAAWRLQLTISSAVAGLLLLFFALALYRLWRAEGQRVQALREVIIARDAAETASLSKSQFLANMSHEIRTPMNAVLGLLNLLLSTELTQRQRDYATKTEGAAQSLLGLLNDILDFSKVEANKMTLESEPFRLDQMLRNLSVVLSANTRGKDVEVLFDVGPELPEVVKGDLLRLQQVLVNLGSNAVKFTAQGQVVLALRRLGGTEHAVTIEFSVRDTGIGIAPEHQEHIFTGFSQAEGSTTRLFGGTGLGLAISRRLVQLMGGDIKIVSAVGAGSTFSFVLELPLVADIPAELATPPRASFDALRVLVVDDNPLAGELTVRMVQSWGWRADLARSGAQALAMVEAQHALSSGALPYPLIYMDWQMPGMDGWQATDRIRQWSRQHQLPQPVVVMVTAQGRDALAKRSEAEQEWLNGFLVKPVTASMLFDAYIEVSHGGAGLRRHGQGRSSRQQLLGMRILLVEDNLINQQVADELLSAEGAIVSLVANGQQGVDAVAAAAPQFDVVLMDIQMPVLDGYGATRLIREQLKLASLPIVAMTANAMSSDREACLAAGMNEHIGKPFDMAKLVSLLIRVTGLQPLQPTLAPAAPKAADQATVPEVPGLDLRAALARMSGMQSLYLRTARGFSKALDTFVEELRQPLHADDRKEVLLRLHTLKGNAGTLGVTDLANLARELEDLCKKKGRLATCMARLGELDVVIKRTQEALGQAIVLLQADAAPAQAKPAAPIDKPAALAALGELEALATASDMNVLQRFADLHDALAGLPDGIHERLDHALQNLDLASVRVLCGEMRARLQQP